MRVNHLNISLMYRCSTVMDYDTWFNITTAGTNLILI